MRLYLLLLLILPGMTIEVCRAQSTRIDSLKADLAARPQADTGRVNRLNLLSQAVQNSNPALAQELARKPYYWQANSGLD